MFNKVYKDVDAIRTMTQQLSAEILKLDVLSDE